MNKPSKLGLSWLIFFMFFGAWSLGGDIIDLWHGLSSIWLSWKIILSIVITVIVIIFWNRIGQTEKSDSRTASRL
jgi:hypothetical protein